MPPSPTRRVLLGATVAAIAAARPARAEPATITVLDVGGALQLIQGAIEAYGKARPDQVGRFVFSQAPAPELAGKLKAQQSAGRVDIDLVLTGSDGLAAGMAQDSWVRLLPDHADRLPGLEAAYEPAALNLLKAQGQGYGIVVAYYPSGPLLEYMPDRVKTPPRTAAELLTWAKAHPNRFMYARPANSGPGRTFMMGLPYLLGDREPKDPVNGWDKTWAYLQELNGAIEYYPAGTTATMKELGDGSRDMIVSTTGWDINPRALGVVPAEAKIATLEGFHWVSDAFFVTIPKGVPEAKLPVLLDLIRFVLQPAQQATLYDSGYLYPGPAVKDVPLSLAPQKSQDIIREFGRPEYAALIRDNPIELPLAPDKLVLAFRKWDELIGSKKK
ncbi:MAG: extracellular solute-binding protein [Rhodospirillales bacterium]|nr:extracellular solute-binding protein [Rhodospirillales bacterium]